MAKTKEEALAPRQSTALAAPSFIKQGDARGQDDIGSNDIRPPALRLAQGGTPEAKASDPAYIEGLREGLVFNSISREIYADFPLRVVVIRSLGHRHVEFAPMSEGGGVLDFNVPDGDPRTQFTEIEKDGKKVRVKPRATMFRDYLVVVLLADGRRELMTLSFKSTQLKKAEIMNTQLKRDNLPLFARQFLFTPTPEQRGQYRFFGWRIDLEGFIGAHFGNDAAKAQELYEFCSTAFDSLAGKTVTVAAENDDESKSNDDAF